VTECNPVAGGILRVDCLDGLRPETWDCNFTLSYVRLLPMTTIQTKPTDLIPALDSLSISCNSADSLMKAIVALLHEKLKSYNWVGFYMLEKDGDREVLALGPFKGAATPHTRIPLNQGICGAAASTGKTVVVDDVNSDPRYLACSLETKSEIVVPVSVHGKVVGELDIDSHVAAAFGPDDRALCEHAAVVLGRFLERTPS
jgi:L-methionine (R)-S-oxide reductase